MDNNLDNTYHNLLTWNFQIADNTQDTQLSIWILFEQGEKPDPIQAELEAIERTEQTRHIHKNNGIVKPDEYYDYLKRSMQSTIEEGYKIKNRKYEILYLN